MTRATHLLLALLAATGWSASAAAQAAIQYDKIEIKTDKLAPNLYMLSGSEGVDPGHPDGAGGRIGVLAGPDGIFMVDAQYLQIGDKVLAAVRRIDAGPIRFLVNTHIHGDHTAGNATFSKLGAVIFAREELREGMARPPANAAAAPARDPARLPVVTYGMGEPVRIRMNGETVELIPGRPHRRRHDDPICECGRDNGRRFLSQLRISLYRRQQRRFAKRGPGSPRT